MGAYPGSAYVVLLTNVLPNFSALSLLMSDLYLRSKELKKIKKEEKKDKRTQSSSRNENSMDIHSLALEHALLPGRVEVADEAAPGLMLTLQKKNSARERRRDCGEINKESRD